MGADEQRMLFAAKRLQSWLDDAKERGASPPMVTPVEGEGKAMLLREVRLSGEGSSTVLSIAYGAGSRNRFALSIGADEASLIRVSRGRIQFESGGEPGEVYRPRWSPCARR